MAFTTIPGSGGAPDSFVGTSGVDAIAFTASRANYFLGAKEADDVVAWVGTENSPLTVTNATVRGGDGNDLFVATDTIFASVFLNGNAGDDFFKFWPGPSALLGSTLQGGQGNDYIQVDAATSSIINGNLGDDRIGVGDYTSTVSNSSVYGGQGNDTINLYGEITDTLIDGGLGNDIINGSAASGFAAYGNEGNDSLLGGNGDDDLQGGFGNDTIHGGQGADTLIGGVGNDIILGGQGDDTITGGKGADTMTGGDGNNNFVLTTGDSFAATAGISNAVLFANGVDYIIDFKTGTVQEPADTVTYNGTVLSISGQSGFGLATIVDGQYQIAQASENGAYGVLGTYSTATQTFTNDQEPTLDYSGDILFFTSAATTGTVAIASVEAIIITETQPLPLPA